MSIKLHTFLIFFYNLFASISVKFDGKVFKISKIILVKNFLLIPFIYFVLNNSIPRTFHVASQKTEDQHFETQFTAFFYLIFYLFVLQFRVAACIIVYVQVFNLKRVIKFLNNCVRIIQHYELEIDFKKFEQKILKLVLIEFATFPACSVVQFVAFFTQSWKGLIDYLILTSYGFIMFSYMNFIRTIMRLLSFLFEDLTQKFEQMSKRKTGMKSERLFQQLLDVDRILKEFEETFNILNSIMTFICFTTLTLKVN